MLIHQCSRRAASCPSEDLGLVEGPHGITGWGGRWEGLLAEAWEPRQEHSCVSYRCPHPGEPLERNTPTKPSKGLLDGQKMTLRNDPGNLLFSLSPHWRLERDGQTLNRPVRTW